MVDVVQMHRQPDDGRGTAELYTAGVVGLAIARQLAVDGYKVTVVETAYSAGA